MARRASNSNVSAAWWLELQGFVPGDLRSAVADGTTPMARACEKGELMMAKWLYEHGAAEDVARPNNKGYTPMHLACYGGHLSVCEWLYEMGVDGDIRRLNNNGSTPMLLACLNGHLSVCEWLSGVGAVGDVTRAKSNGSTPMYLACMNGHLSVCEWLHRMGAAGDITRAVRVAKDRTATPMRWACTNGHLSICLWLIFNGALNDPETHHVRRETVERDTLWGIKYRPVLLVWAGDIVTTHDTFFNVVLRASVVLPSSQQQACPGSRCRLPLVPHEALKSIGAYLGVECGRRLRNIREFHDALVTMTN